MSLPPWQTPPVADTTCLFTPAVERPRLGHACVVPEQLKLKPVDGQDEVYSGLLVDLPEAWFHTHR